MKDLDLFINFIDMFLTIVLAILFVMYGIPLIIALLGWLFGSEEGLILLWIIIITGVVICSAF